MSNSSQIFPDVSEALEDGLLAIGGELTPELVLHAYSKGIFPWPTDSRSEIPWFSPDPRAILDLNKIHISKRLIRTVKSNKYEVKFNTNFKEVIRQCSSIKRKGEPGTWITKEMEKCFNNLFLMGNAHSAESYYNGELVGGVYGIKIDNFYSAESMFYARTDASKVALAGLIQKLQKEQVTFIDIQMVTPVTASFGAIEISRTDFLKRIKLNNNR